MKTVVDQTGLDWTQKLCPKSEVLTALIKAYASKEKSKLKTARERISEECGQQTEPKPGTFSESWLEKICSNTKPVEGWRLLKLAHFFGKTLSEISETPNLIATPRRNRKTTRLVEAIHCGLVGRAKELAKLRQLWRTGEVSVVAVKGFGGEGKTALLQQFFHEIDGEYGERPKPFFFCWDFYHNPSTDEFFGRFLDRYGSPSKRGKHKPSTAICASDAARLIEKGHVARPIVVFLDGFEVLLRRSISNGKSSERAKKSAFNEWKIADEGMRAFLLKVATSGNRPASGGGLVAIGTRQPITDLEPFRNRYSELQLGRLDDNDARKLFIQLIKQPYRGSDVAVSPSSLKRFVEQIAGHALTITLCARLLVERFAPRIDLDDLTNYIKQQEMEVCDRDLTESKQHRLPGYILRHCLAELQNAEKELLRLLSCSFSPVSEKMLKAVGLHCYSIRTSGDRPNNSLLECGKTKLWNEIIPALRKLNLIVEDPNARCLSLAHPLIKDFFYNELEFSEENKHLLHLRFFEVLRDETGLGEDFISDLSALSELAAHGCRVGRFGSVYAEAVLRRIAAKPALEDKLIQTVPATILETLRHFFCEPEWDCFQQTVEVGPDPLSPVERFNVARIAEKCWRQIGGYSSRAAIGCNEIQQTLLPGLKSELAGVEAERQSDFSIILRNLSNHRMKGKS